MTWRIAEAKQQFSEVLRQAASEPQIILNRDQAVAAIVDLETFQQFEVWRRERQKPQLATALAELRKLCAQDDQPLEIPTDPDRPNAFADALDDVPG